MDYNRISLFGFCLVDIKKKQKDMSIKVDGKKILISIKDKNADEVYNFIEKELDNKLLEFTFLSPEHIVTGTDILKSIKLKKEGNAVYFMDFRKKGVIG